MVTRVGTVGSVGMVFCRLCQLQQMDIVHRMREVPGMVGSHVWPMFTWVWTAHCRVTPEKVGTPCRTGIVMGAFVAVVNATVRAYLSVVVRGSEFIS